MSQSIKVLYGIGSILIQTVVIYEVVGNREGGGEWEGGGGGEGGRDERGWIIVK